jgi:hypothetical protein
MLQSQGFTIGTLSDSAIAIDTTQSVAGCGTVRLRFALARTATGYTYSESSQIPCVGNNAVAATVTYEPRAVLTFDQAEYRTPPVKLGTPGLRTIEVRNTGKVATTLTPQISAPVVVTAGGTCTATLGPKATCTYVVDASSGPAGCYASYLNVNYTNGLTTSAGAFVRGCVSPVVSAPTQVAVGASHFCVMHAGGVSCYGSNGSGQTTVPTVSNVTRVFAGGDHSCVIRTNGHNCWGANGSGELSLGVSGLPRVIAFGYQHNCAISGSQVGCAGNNSYNQVFPIPAMTNPTELAAYGSTNCAIDGTTVRCWGDAGFTLGMQPAMTNPTAIVVGYLHACVIDSGFVRCWGDNNEGQTTVPALTNPTAVAIADRSTCALDDSGVHCWGSAAGGRLDVPTLTQPITSLVGYERFCALDATGVVCW